MKPNVAEDWKARTDRQTLGNILKIFECEFFHLALTADGILCIYPGS